jgi:hypothetical protein
MKWFHNGSVGRILAIGFAIFIHAWFAAGAYYFGRFIGSYIFSDIPFGADIAGVGLAILVFGGAMFGFIYLEYAREDVQSYAKSRNDGGKMFINSLGLLQFAIVAMEASSLLYRVYTINDPLKQFVVLLLGLAALVIAWALGKIVHAMANRPLEVAYLRVREQVGRSVVEDGMKYRNDMTADQKRRFYNGDASVIDEVRGIKERNRIREERKAQEQEDEEMRAKEQGQGFIKTMLSWPGKHRDNPADVVDSPVSSNGKQSGF